MSSQISQLFTSIECKQHREKAEFIHLSHPLIQNQKRILCYRCDFNGYTNVFNKNQVFEFLDHLDNEQKRVQEEIETACNFITELKSLIISIEQQFLNKKQKLKQNFYIKPDNSLGEFLQKRYALTLEVITKMSNELSCIIMQDKEKIELIAENINLESLKIIQEIDFRKFESMVNNLQKYVQQVQQIQQVQQVQQISQEQSLSMILNQSFVNNTSINYVQLFTKDIGQQLIYDLKFNQNGNVFVVSSNLINDQNCYVQIYTIQNNNFHLTQNLDLHQGDVKSICFNSQDDNFITACQDKKIRFWKKIEEKKWSLDQELIDLKSPPNCIQLNHSENYLVSGGDYLCFWKRVNEKWTYDTECSIQEQTILLLNFSLDDNQLAVGYDNQMVRIFEYYNQKWVQKTQLQKQAILIYFFNQKDLIGLQKNGYFNYYEYDSEISDYQVFEYSQNQQNERYVSDFCLEQKLLVLSGNQEKSTNIYMIKENKISKSLQTIPFQGDKLFFSKDGNQLCIISNKQLLIYQHEIDRY